MQFLIIFNFSYPFSIGLPKESGRVQILNIHTSKMKANGKLSPDVDIAELAKLTKNFSGAEIEGLVRASQAGALNRLVKAGKKVIDILIVTPFSKSKNK